MIAHNCLLSFFDSKNFLYRFLNSSGIGTAMLFVVHSRIFGEEKAHSIIKQSMKDQEKPMFGKGRP